MLCPLSYGRVVAKITAIIGNAPAFAASGTTSRRSLPTMARKRWEKNKGGGTGHEPSPRIFEQGQSTGPSASRRFFSPSYKPVNPLRYRRPPLSATTLLPWQRSVSNMSFSSVAPFAWIPMGSPPQGRRRIPCPAVHSSLQRLSRLVISTRRRHCHPLSSPNQSDLRAMIHFSRPYLYRQKPEKKLNIHLRTFQ